MSEKKRMEREILTVFGLEEILCQTAEECAELSQACLKLRRVLRGTTDADKEAVIANLQEEMGDVLNCLSVLSDASFMKRNMVFNQAWDKLIRWNRHAMEYKEKKHEGLLSSEAGHGGAVPRAEGDGTDAGGNPPV